jgi:hypothetical protein
MADESFELDVHVDGSPEALEAWWTDLPAVHEAEDPREQPHRIEHVETTDDAEIYETYWRGPLGIEYSLTEELYDEGPGRWRFVVPNPGFTIQDHYEVEPEGEGARLRIRSQITYENVLGKLVRRVMVPNWKDQFHETFTSAVAVFEDRQTAHPSPAET